MTDAVADRLRKQDRKGVMEMNKKEQKNVEFDRLTLVEIVKRVDGIQENINLLKEFLTTLGIPLNAYAIWGYEGALEEDEAGIAKY